MRTLALAAAATLLAAAPAAAAPLCGDRARILDRLAERYGERPRILALDDGGGVMEILVSPTGSWTLLVTPPTAPHTCILTTGEALEILPAGAPS